MNKQTAIRAVKAEHRRKLLSGYIRNLWGEGFYADTEFALFWNEREILVVIRGTDSVLNALLDFAIPLTERTFYGRVGRGVEYGWSQTKEVILKKLRYVAELDEAREEKPERRLVFIGHSLGGALAARAAFAFVEEKLIDPEHLLIDAVEAWLFNSPRWCDETFAAVYQDRVPLTRRYFHRRDPVSRLPLAGWGFRHVGVPCSLGEKGLPLPRYHRIDALEE